MGSIQSLRYVGVAECPDKDIHYVINAMEDMYALIVGFVHGLRKLASK